MTTYVIIDHSVSFVYQGSAKARVNIYSQALVRLRHESKLESLNLIKYSFSNLYSPLVICCISQSEA